MLLRSFLQIHYFVISLSLSLSPSLFLTGLLLDTTEAAPASPQAEWQSQLQTIQNSHSDWQKYVRSPKIQVVKPVRIISNYTQGNVSNPEGLLRHGRGATVFTRAAPSTATWALDSSASDEAPAILVDFGQNVAGYLSIKFAGASNSTPGLPGIRLAFSETIQYGYLTDVSDFSRSYNGDTITPGSDQIAVKPKAYTWTDVHGCDYGDQVCADGLHGFRYVKIYMDALPADAPYTSSYGQVAIDSISLNFTAFLGTPDTFTGRFESSDENLNQWWYDAIYTNDMNIDHLEVNSTDPRNAASPSLIGKLVLLDGAKRDRDPYVGDIAVSGRTLYLSHQATEAARNVLADLADHQRDDGWIPPASINNYQLKLLDYPLWWIVCAYDIYMYIDDVAFVQTYYQNMVNVLDKFYPSITNPATQLITKGFGVSGNYGDYAFLDRTGPVTYYNALYVLALKNAASIARSLGGHDADAARWTARAQNVSIAMNSRTFDNAAGAFFDGGCGAVACQTHAQDGNSLSIVSGAVNSSRADQILSYMSKEMARPYGNAFYDNDLVGAQFSQRVYAFISYFELEARFLTGKTASALDQIRRMYGWMASNDPGITMWEGIGTGGLPYETGYTSMAHGWSTGIVPALTNYVLGVTPTGPGFSTFSVKPMPGDVQWARGTVPTPKGPITVVWSNNAQLGLFYLSVDSPAGTSATISVPVSSSSSVVFVNSTPAWGNEVSKGYDAQFVQDNGDGYVSVQMGGGQQHTVTVGFSQA